MSGSVVRQSLVGSLLLLSGLLAACGADTALPTLGEVVATTPTLTTLAELVEGTEIEALLADETTTYTLFAPADLAFDVTLGDEVIVENLLRDHVVVGRISSSQPTVTTLLGRTLSLAQGEGTTLILDGDIRLEKPVDVANGTLYILDTTVDTPTLGGLVAADGRFSTLLSIAQQSGLVSQLGGDDPLTLFAPTDAAFRALGDLPSERALADIVRYHLVPEQLVFDALRSRDTVDTLQGGLIEIAANAATLFLNSNAAAVLSVGDQQRGLNGVLYVLDVVLDVPETTLADRVARSDDLTTFADAVDTAGLTELLTGDGPQTLFAPTDAAFAALPDGVLAALLGDPTALAALLRYHVVADETIASDRLLSESPGTLTSAATARHADVGLTLTYTTLTNVTTELRLNDQATLTAADLNATNGVLHKIDAVLMPLTMLELLTQLPDTDQLRRGLIRVDTAFPALGLLAILNDEVAASQPLTLFAPDNDALSDLPSDDDALLAQLGSHLLTGQSRPLGDLIESAPEPLTTFSAQQNLAGTLTTTATNGRLGLIGRNAVLVDAGDIAAVNGVLHRISDGLEPTRPLD